MGFPTEASMNMQVHDDYTRLFNNLYSRLPLNCLDRVGSIEEIMLYVFHILYGDDIERFCAHEYRKDYVTAALDELVAHVQMHSLTQYRQELELLRKEVSDCLRDKEQYKKELLELDSEKKELQGQVDSLRKENELLAGENKSVIESINSCSAAMKSILGDNQVTWENVKENHPIYSITRNTITDYIKGLERAYILKLGVSEEECQSDFLLNSAGLYELRSLLLSFQSDSNFDKSISTCIRSRDYLGIDYPRGRDLMGLMDNIKLPRIIVKKPTLPTINLSIPDGNLNGLLRELSYQKIAFEAVAKQRIAEAQLYSLVMSLKQAAPESFDFTQFTELFDASPIKQLLEDSNHSFVRAREK